MGIPADLGARVVFGDPAQDRCDFRIEERLTGLARVAEQSMHSMPANAGHRILECVENVWDSPRVGMLVEDFEAATSDYRALVRQPPDQGLDLLRGKLLAPVLPRATPARRQGSSRSVPLGRDLEAIDDFEIRIHLRPRPLVMLPPPATAQTARAPEARVGASSATHRLVQFLHGYVAEVLSEVPLVALEIFGEVDPVAKRLVGRLLQDLGTRGKSSLVVGIDVVDESVDTRADRARAGEVPRPDTCDAA